MSRRQLCRLSLKKKIGYKLSMVGSQPFWSPKLFVTDFVAYGNFLFGGRPRFKCAVTTGSGMM